MSKLTVEIIRKIHAQMEVAARYENVRPIEQHLALTAVRLFLHRFGYDQIVSNLKVHGADRMAKAAQHELKDMAETWTYALELEPPPLEKEADIRRDVLLVNAGATSKDINARIHKIMARLQIREDMIQNRRASPPPMVQ
jgi:hypothetical protein